MRVARAGSGPAPDRADIVMSAGHVSGAQALERALVILREIANDAEQGRRLVDLQRLTRLTKPTARRLLKTLQRHGFVSQDESTRRYFVGPEVALLALSVRQGPSNVCAFAGDALQKLAEDTGDTAFLAIRSGNDVVFVDRRLGPYPIKALTGEVGSRRPLGVGAAGTALLAALPDEDINSILAANAERMRHYPNVSSKLIRRAVKEARTRGYSYSDGHTIKAVRGLGVAIRNDDGQVIAALSVGAIRERITRANMGMLVAALDRGRRMIERRLRQAPSRGTVRRNGPSRP